MRVKVKPTCLGYYGDKRRREGEVFDLVPRQDRKGKIITVEEQFSEVWMEKVDDATPEFAPSRKQAPMKPGLSEAARDIELQVTEAARKAATEGAQADIKKQVDAQVAEAVASALAEAGVTPKDSPPAVDDIPADDEPAPDPPKGQAPSGAKAGGKKAAKTGSKVPKGGKTVADKDAL